MIFQRQEHATFVLADPPRHSWLALWSDSDSDRPADPEREDLAIALVRGGVAQSTKVAVRRLPIRDAIDALIELPATQAMTPSVHAWAATTRIAVDLIGRGLLRPGVTPAGFDAWTVGPLTAEDDGTRSRLARALPAEAFAASPTDDGDLHVVAPETAIEAFTAAIADAMPRTTAAAKVTGVRHYAGDEPVSIDPTTAAWLSALSPTRSDAGVLFRVVVPSEGNDAFRLRLVVRSRSDSTFEVEAAQFWDEPLQYAPNVGADAADNVLLVLRRAAAVWPGANRLLDETNPAELVLTTAELHELLGDATQDLRSVGITVDWPKQAVSDLQLIPVVTTTSVPTDRVSAETGETSLSLNALADLKWEVAIDGVELTAEELASIRSSPHSLLWIRDRWVRLDADDLERMDEERALSVGEALGLALGSTAAGADDTGAPRVTGPIAELATRLASLDTKEPAVAHGFSGVLRDYQERGLTWLAEMTDLGLGGVLADDMGLGKTIQILALHLARPNLGPALVVCPATLISNWEREANHFAPGIPVRRFHGAERTLDDLAPNEIVVATYGLVRRDSELLGQIDWGLLVADEAQAVKNPQSRTARELRGLRARARFALTGTPVENHLLDLWALLDWTTPGLLGPQAQFRREVALPIERSRDEARAEAFSRLIAPFVLRRRKTDPEVAPELPPKTETDQFVSLTEEQQLLYRATTEAVMNEIESSVGIARRGLVLKLITGLKQICNHPAHFLRETGPVRRRSSKLDTVDELLDVIVDEGEQALVFTQYVAMGTLLERHLLERGLRIRFLHGSVPVAKRQAMVDEFQNGDADVFVLSLKAGGTGLNLTAATHVIHYDRWWNPAVEDQASDRAWRIGQDKPVQVHRMVCEGTLEERIAAVIDQKRELAESIIGGSEQWISEMSNDELTDLVTLTLDDYR